MRTHVSRSRRSRMVALGACLAISIGAMTYAQSRVAAEDSDASPKSQEHSRKTADSVRKKKSRTTKTAAAKPAESVASPPPANPPPATPKAEGRTSTPIDFAARLEKANTSPCRAQINALASSTMGGVEQFNTVANYSQVSTDQRAVSMAIGQKYPDKSPVPFGVSQIISAPNQAGTCDSITVQVVPSPLPCGKLRETMMAQKGSQLGDLVGMALIQDQGGRTLLVPASTDTCVLVATRFYYPK